MARYGLRVGVVDDHPPVAFEVAAHRRMAGDVDALEQFLVRHRPGEIEPLADLLGGLQEEVGLIEIEAGRRVLRHRPRMAWSERATITHAPWATPPRWCPARTPFTDRRAASRPQPRV
jgi:hypothetical protein